MKDLLTESYTYYYLLCTLSTFMTQKLSNEFKGSSKAVSLLLPTLSNIGVLICTVFLILVCFYATEWWYAIILLIAGFIIKVLPIPYKILGLIGIIVIPISGFMMFYNLF